MRGVLGEGYFQTQLGHLDDYVQGDPTTIHLPGGFWGHLGVLVKGYPRYMWFPITAYTRHMIYQNRTKAYMAIPCMDNTLLLLNCDHLEELVLLDDACDEPADMDWDPNVDCGAIPAVVYEAFDDYRDYKASDGYPYQHGLSEKLAAAIDDFVSEHGIDPEEFAAGLRTATILFAGGRVKTHDLYDMGADDLMTAVKYIYETGSLLEEEVVTFEESGGAEAIINFRNISLLKLPLAKVEAMIEAERKEIMADLEG